jgi:cation:H+ antiporter
MIDHLLFILCSLVCLAAGAEGLVRGSASLATRAGLSALAVGLTVVAFGTSSPELVVSLNATLAGQGDIAVGNVVGSNCFNTGIILGLTSLICPVRVHSQLIRLDAPFALAASAVLPITLLDGQVGRVEGGLLVLGLIAYISWILRLARSDSAIRADLDPAIVPKVSKHWLLDVVLIAGGLGLLLFGSRLLIEHATAIAQLWGVSEAVIGLTVVAAGTSMPELATSLVAAVRGQPDIAIGNIVGSNIFNILAIIGLTSLTAPIAAGGITALDFGVMLAFAALLIPLLYTDQMVRRLEGALLVGIYGVYMAILWPK